MRHVQMLRFIALSVGIVGKGCLEILNVADPDIRHEIGNGVAVGVFACYLVYGNPYVVVGVSIVVFTCDIARGFKGGGEKSPTGADA